MFWSFCLVCNAVSRIADKIMNEFACMKLLLQVYLGLRHNLINFRDDLDYDLDPGFGLRFVLHGGGLQSLTDYLVIYVIGVQLPFCFNLSN